MKLKRIFAVCAALAVSALMLAAAACGSSSDEQKQETEHTHTYSEEWSMNGGYHWHEPTCGDTDQVSGRGEHRFIGTEVCRVCGFDRGAYGTLTIDDVTVMPGYAESRLHIAFSDPSKAEPLTYSYDTSSISIDEEAGTVSGTKEGTYSVEALSDHFYATFEVIVSEPDFSDSYYDTDRFASTISSRAAEWEQNASGSTTVFIGDSFFDPWGWADFYTDYVGYDVKLLGISSTTSCHWEEILYEDMIFKPDTAVPANFVVNIGTNNYYDSEMEQTDALASIQRMFLILHQKFPDAKIYYYSITQRTNTGYRNQVAATNAAMENWCGGYNWITFIDTASKTTSSDLRDGTHLTPEAYRSIFMPALEEAGCAIAPLGAASEDIADIVRAVSDRVASSVSIVYKGEALSRNFILSGKAVISETDNNGHVEFRFGSGDGGMNSRFLIWNNQSDGIFRITAAYDTGNPLIRTLTFDGGLEFDWKLVVTDNDAYLYVNDVLSVILTEIGTQGPLYVGSENLAVTFSDMQAVSLSADEEEYETELAAMQSVIGEYGDKNTSQTIEFPAA